MSESVFSIISYGAPLAQRAFYLALYSSLFGPDGAVILSLTACVVYVVKEVMSFFGGSVN